MRRSIKLYLECVVLTELRFGKPVQRLAQHSLHKVGDICDTLYYLVNCCVNEMPGDGFGPD